MMEKDKPVCAAAAAAKEIGHPLRSFPRPHLAWRSSCHQPTPSELSFFQLIIIIAVLWSYIPLRFLNAARALGVFFDAFIPRYQR